jgi:hypothetical protein
MQSKAAAQGDQKPVASYKLMTAQGKGKTLKLSNIICTQMIGAPRDIQQGMENNICARHTPEMLFFFQGHKLTARMIGVDLFTGATLTQIVDALKAFILQLTKPSCLNGLPPSLTTTYLTSLVKCSEGGMSNHGEIQNGLTQ